MTAPLARSRLLTYVELTKPRIIELLLVTTIPAMAVAADGWPGFELVIVTLIGGTLTAGGANVVNQVYDRDIDRLMRRTEARPIPTDRVEPRHAFAFGILLGLAGFTVLSLGANLLAGALSIVAFVGYTVLYTVYLKRSTTQNIVLGGAAGAVPALIGWAAYADDLSLAPWLMFGIIFYWTPPHFWALSLKYEADYERAGVPMLSVVAGEQPTLSNILWYSFLTAAVAVALVPVAGLGWIYAVTTLALVAAFVVLAVRLTRDGSRAMSYFVFSNLVLAGVFLSMLVDRIAQTSPLDGAGWAIAAAAAALVGVVGVAYNESRPGMRAAGVSIVRHVAEVSASLIFVVILIVLAF